MDILWEKIKNLDFRYKLAWGYTLVFTVLFAIGFYSIYAISEKYRKQEFFQRLKDRTLTTYRIMVEVDQIDYNMLSLFDKNTINSLYDEKILLFDSSFTLIYSSFTANAKYYPVELLDKLKNSEDEIELTEGKYEIIGIRFSNNGRSYYGVARAFDRFGKNKIEFLGISLIVIFLIATLIITLLSLYLAKIITNPITKLTREIESISTEDLSIRIDNPTTKDEVAVLSNKFNELLDKVENAFKFQKNLIHHISHELKTPLAIMISNAETALSDLNGDSKKEESLRFIRHTLMEMSHIINAMLDISKMEHQLADVFSEYIRLDELIFECIDELSYLDGETGFDFKMDKTIEDSEKLIILGNSRMLKMAIINLLKNALDYSHSIVPIVELRSYSDRLELNILNDGDQIPEIERTEIFKYLFRGTNAKGKKGFGLGLVLVHRIATLHHAKIQYSLSGEQLNCFTLVFPLP